MYWRLVRLELNCTNANTFEKSQLHVRRVMLVGVSRHFFMSFNSQGSRQCAVVALTFPSAPVMARLTRHHSPPKLMFSPLSRLSILHIFDIWVYGRLHVCCTAGDHVWLQGVIFHYTHWANCLSKHKTFASLSLCIDVELMLTRVLLSMSKSHCVAPVQRMQKIWLHLLNVAATLLTQISNLAKLLFPRPRERLLSV